MSNSDEDKIEEKVQSIKEEVEIGKKKLEKGKEKALEILRKHKEEETS